MLLALNGSDCVWLGLAMAPPHSSSQNRRILHTRSKLRTAGTTLKALRQKLHLRRHEPVPVIGNWLRRVVKGYFNYHAVPGNSRRLSVFRKEVGRAWLHALRRRGQHGRTTWAKMRRYVARYLPLVRVIHPYPNERFAA